MFAHYVALAIRSLKRNQILTAFMILAIAVGIGASMTTLTMMYMLSGNPLPMRSQYIYYPQVDTVKNSDNLDNTGPPDMMDYTSATELWNSHRADKQTLVISSATDLKSSDSMSPAFRVRMLATTGDFFSMFDVPLQFGTDWTHQDDEARARITVISDDLNKRLFSGTNSVGKIISLHGTAFRIIGVLKPWRPTPLFYQVYGGEKRDANRSYYYNRPQDVIVPFFTALEARLGIFSPFKCWGPIDLNHMQNSHCAWVVLWVQLNNHAAVVEYKNFLKNYAHQQKDLGRFQFTDTKLRNLMQWLDYNDTVPHDARLQSWLALGFLLVCLFNTMGLLMAKFLNRSMEFGVRRALGAPRKAIFTQCIVEAGFIGLLGGVAGWALTLFGLWLVRSQQIAYADLAHLNTTMFLLTFVVAISASMLAGVVPALRASRVVPALHLKTL